MKVVSRRIEKVYGTNPILMGEVENANRASATVADKIHLDVVINPRLEMIGQVLTAFVQRSTLFNDKSVICYYKPVVSRDPELEAKDWQYARTHGTVSDDEFRIHRLGLPPKKEGGEFARINFQLVPVLVDGEQKMAPVPQAGPLGDTGEPSKAIKSVKAAVPQVWQRMHARNENLIADQIEAVMLDSVKVVDNGDGLGIGIEVGESFADDLKLAIRDSLRAAAMSGAGVQESIFKSSSIVTRKDVSDILFGLDGTVGMAVERELDELFAREYWGDIGDGVATELRGHLQKFIDDGMAQEDMAAAL